ncbi:PKD1L3 [Branchiostoma lanceolatum]|uniref:PKD1L3 protein n=1 Tax=Branchiostoma lanceolatum TaxID=7740 RepID=A0A8J9ZC97_BRALA|nr:PKD1L3 [Branchiostoma lanceolatum]
MDPAGCNRWRGFLTAGITCWLLLVAAAQCPTLTPPDNGALSPVGVNSYNDEVTFTCNQGYEIEGAIRVTCQANQIWTDPVPTCTQLEQRRVCFREIMTLQCPAGRRINVVSAMYGRLSRAYCSGVVARTGCRSESSLSRVRSVCQGESTCSVMASAGLFGDPCRGTSKYLEVEFTCAANGALSPIGVKSYNDEVTFTCNQGYVLEGASSVRCQADRAWSHPVPTCTDNGALSPIGVKSYNDEVTFTCNQGYALDGASSVRCQADRAWSHPVPTCTAVDPPMNLTVTDVTDEGFNITWSPSTDPDLHGYHVEVSELDTTTAFNQSTNETWLQVVGLAVETDYIIKVTTLVLSHGRGSQSNATTTGATTRMSSSTDMEFVNVTETTTSLGFTWVPPDAVVTGYRIMYGQEEATEQLIPSPGPGDRSALLEGLQPDTMYKVEIITIGVHQESLPLVGHNSTEPDECATVNGWCDQGCTNVPGGYMCYCRQGFVLMVDAHGCGAVEPPVNLVISDVTDKGFKITWSPSPDPDLHGYRVVVSKLDMTTAVNQYTNQTSLLVTDLSPDSAYVIGVTSLFLTDGWRSQSETAVIDTSTEMSSSTDLRFIEVTEFSLNFTWVPPDAVVTGYRIMYGQEAATELLTPSPGQDDSSALIEGLYPGVMYKVEIITIGVYRESAPLVGDATNFSCFNQPRECTYNRDVTDSSCSKQPNKSYDFFLQRTNFNYISKDTGNYFGTAESRLDSIYGDVISSNPHAQDVLRMLARTIADDEGGDDTDVELEKPTSAAEEKTQNTALDVLKSITSKLDKLDMSDPFTVESVGGSLVESVASLLYASEEDAEEDGENLQSDPVDDDHVSPVERAQKAKQKEEERRAERQEVVQKSQQVLDDLFHAIAEPMRPGAPPVTITRGGITLRAQKIFGSKSGSRVVLTEDGGFQFPSQTALFPEHPPHNITFKLTEYQQNPYPRGRGYYQARSSVMELSIHRKNYKPLVFNNLTDDFIITIPGKSGNKPTTKNITFPASGNQTSSYHLLNLNNTAEGWLVTITPLNKSVAYGVSGRYGGRPDDQNYNVSMETYVLSEECSLVETLSGDEMDKTEATMFINGKKDPVEYYVKVQILGPVTKCDVNDRTDEKKAHTNEFYAYQIQWARLSCVFWSETKESWEPDGCTISAQSTVTSTTCHCNHLTAFGSDFATPPDTVDFGALTLRDLRDNGVILTTIFVVFCLFLLILVITRVIDLRSRKKKNPSINLDDLQNDFQYRLHIWTGTSRHAGTESTVAFNLHGDAATSGVRVVNITEKVFTIGSQVTLNFSTTEQLGNVELLQLMHDNSGEGSRASWNVDRAAVQDLTTGKPFYFFCGEWLAADRGDGQVAKTFPVATEQDLRSFGFLFPATLRSNMAEEHLFLSVAIMPEDSTFTRSERLGCCLSFLTLSMVASAMWLSNEDATQVVQAVSLGPFSFTLNTVYTGIMIGITCIPVIVAIVLLFQYSRPSSKGGRRVRDVETADPAEAPTQQGPAKGLPHWCKYVAWVLVVLSAVGSAIFTVLYSLEWGKDKSEGWLSAYFMSFLLDIFLLQQAKMSLANVKDAQRRRDRDRKIGDVLWVIVRFCVFLMLVVTITNAHHNTTPAFHQTQSAADRFMHHTDAVTDPLAFWAWLDETALEIFYSETSYNGDKPRWRERGFTADMQSVLVSPPSLIQARVKQGLCTVPVTMQYLFEECTAAYDESTKETGAYERGWKRVTNMSEVGSEAPGWSHRLSGYTIKPIFGVKSHYWGDGFSLDLGKSADEMRSILADLKAHRWIDRRTRAVILEGLLYNGNLDLFTSLTVMFEFSEMSGVFSHRHLHTFRLHQRPGTIGYIYVMLEIIYVIILLYSLWKEAKAARAAGLAYLKEPWNIVEIFNFILAFTVIALYGSNRGYSSKALSAVRMGKDQLQYIKTLVNINLMYGWFLSFLAFVNIMKFLRLLRFDPFLAKLMSVFRGMAVEFLAFVLYFFLCFSGFGACAYLMFGTTVTAYRSISLSYSTLFQMSLGLFDYRELLEEKPILGPIFFVTFMCIIFLVLMNIAMAIINRALPDVRNHDMPEEDRFFLKGMEDSDLPTEPDFVPQVKNVSKDATEELSAPSGDIPVIVIRPASQNTLTETAGRHLGEVVTAPSRVRVKTQHLVVGKILTYNHIHAAQSLLRRQYPALKGLENPTIGLYEVGFAKMTGKGLQIHHSDNMHWVLSSYTDGQVCLYDSLGVAMTKSLQIQLCQSYAAFADHEANVLAVLLPEVQRQWNADDCGLYAIAWAVDIAEGQDVSRVVYDDRKMRSHLQMCFKEGNLTPFPRLTSRRKRVGPTMVHQITLVCHCEQGGRLGRMERCRACRRIFHVSCLATSPPWSYRTCTWVCGECAV